MILLDTHVVIWLSYDFDRISPKAQVAIRTAREKGSGLAVSAMTLIEIARLSSHGRIHFAPDLETFLSEVELRFKVLPITANVAMRAFALPPNFPKDPVDRCIVATALIEDVALITADKEIRRSRVTPVIW